MVQTAGPGQRGGATVAAAGGAAPQKVADTPPATGVGNPMRCSVLL